MVSREYVGICTRNTYDSHFATELVLDLTSLDRTRRVLLNKLEEVLDTHLECVLRSVACGIYPQLVLATRRKFAYRQQLEAGEEVTIARTTSRRVQGLRAVTATHFDQSARAPHPTFHCERRATSM